MHAVLLIKKISDYLRTDFGLAVQPFLAATVHMTAYMSEWTIIQYSMLADRNRHVACTI